MFFADRADAGRRLAEALAKETPLTDGPRLVAALPRGGVVVGAQVARALGSERRLQLLRDNEPPADWQGREVSWLTTVSPPVSPSARPSVSIPGFPTG